MRYVLGFFLWLTLPPLLAGEVKLYDVNNKIAYDDLTSLDTEAEIAPETSLSEFLVAPQNAQLNNLVLETVRTHPNVESRLSAVKEAELGVRIAQLQYYPSPSVQVNRLDNGTSTTSLVLTQPLWTWGRLAAGVDVANNQKMSADFSVLESQYNLALNVVSVYQSLQMSLGRQLAFRRNLQRLETLEAMVRRRMTLGASPQSDGDLISARLDQARSELTAEVANGNAALVQLSMLVGREVRIDEFAVQVGVGDSNFFSDENEKKYIDYATTQHPVLSRYTADVAVAESQYKQQKASLLPTISLQAQRNINTAVAGLGADASSISLSVLYQPGAGLTSFKQSESAEVHIQTVKGLRDAAERSLVQSIQVEWQSGRSATNRLKNASANAITSKNILDSYKRLFITGKRSWYDVLNVARDLVVAEQALAEVDAELVVTQYRIDLLSGKFPWLGDIN